MGRTWGGGWEALLLWPQLPAPCPSASCLSRREPGAFQEHCPREEDPRSPLGPGWPQVVSGPFSSPKKNGSGAQDGFSWAQSVLRTGLANRTSFSKLRKGLEVNAGEGCHLPRVDRTASPLSSCKVSIPSPQPALPQAWLGPGGSSQGRSCCRGWSGYRPPACERSLEAAGLSLGLGRHPPTLPPSDPTPSVQLLFIRKRMHLKPQVGFPQPGDLIRPNPRPISAHFETLTSRLHWPAR